MSGQREVSTMKVTYAGQDLPERNASGIVPNSIFLAGPTPRSEDVKSWRPEALTLLEEQGFNGHVFVPETSEWGWLGDYAGQVHWEWEALGKAACTLFWVPRDLETMPAFTTNVEFGFMIALAPERVVLGHPGGAPKMRYLTKLCTDVHSFHRCFEPAHKITRSPIMASSLQFSLLLAIGVADPSGY
jgi:nucleoside 2-deoxyribosyltransferase-like protein